VNCILGRFRMDNGVLSPDALVIDTSNIRICGWGKADFKQGTLRFNVAPIPKRPQFFSLATPFEVSGRFETFDMGIQPGGLMQTAVNFVTSPLHVPLRTIAGEKLPSDGSDVCQMQTDTKSRPTSPPPGCEQLVTQPESVHPGQSDP